MTCRIGVDHALDHWLTISDPVDAYFEPLTQASVCFEAHAFCKMIRMFAIGLCTDALTLNMILLPAILNRTLNSTFKPTFVIKSTCFCWVISTSIHFDRCLIGEINVNVLHVMQDGKKKDIEALSYECKFSLFFCLFLLAPYIPMINPSK